MQAQRAKDNTAQAEARKADGLGYGQITPIPLSLFFIPARQRRAGMKNKERGQVRCPGLNYACAFSAAARAFWRRLCGKKNSIKANCRIQRPPRGGSVCILRFSGTVKALAT
jgi:hypothetical protein